MKKHKKIRNNIQSNDIQSNFNSSYCEDSDESIDMDEYNKGPKDCVLTEDCVDNIIGSGILRKFHYTCTFFIII